MITVDGVSLAYEVHGTGTPAVVLVHGWSCDRSHWDGQVGPLSREFQVVTMDLAGHGESGTGREKWTMATFGADVAAVVNELGLEHVVLVGHSMGGDVIVEAARRLPGRVEGLIWVDTYRKLPTSRTREQVRERMAPFRDDFAKTAREFARGMFHANADPALIERVSAHIAAAHPEVALPAMESAWTCGDEIAAAVLELGLPLVAINPDDSRTDLESMKRYGVEVVLMPGVGHFPMMEAPEGFNERLIQVVDGFGE